MFFSSIREVNGLISKGMSNIYLNIAIEKHWRSQNFDFVSLKKLSPFWRAPTHAGTTVF